MAEPGRKPDVEDEELLSALAGVTDPTESPVATAGDVAERVPINRDATRKRLNTLASEGPARRRNVGPGVVFWLPPDDDRQTQLDELEEEREDDDRPNVVEDEDGRTVAVDQLVADLWTWLEDRPPKTPHARQALADVFRRLLEEAGEGVKTAELKEIVYSGSREDEWKDKKTAWESITKYLDDLPGIKKPGWGEWAVDPDDAGREVAR